MKDRQLCMNKESKELYNFIGNMNGDYKYDLGVFEDCFGCISICKISDFVPVTPEQAKELDPLMFDILYEVFSEDK